MADTASISSSRAPNISSTPPPLRARSVSLGASTSEKDSHYVALTHDLLDIPSTILLVRQPSAGAIALFGGTTRDNSEGKPIVQLQYSAYIPMALRSMNAIARDIKKSHEICAIAMVHRLGVVPIGEESILVVVSAPHREAAWRAGEEAVNRLKDDVEVWKLETFEDGEGVWKSNRGEVDDEAMSE